MLIEHLEQFDQFPERFRFRYGDVGKMYNVISKEFLRLEETQYRNGWVYPAEAKLLFLVGTDEIDVTKAETSTGIPIYTKEATHIKAPEIVEAISAISDHFEREKNVPNVLLELADVWYNLIQLTRIDEDFAPTYQKCIDELCVATGYDLEDACKLVLLKYEIRLMDNTGNKHHSDELKVVTFLLNKPGGLPKPNDEAFNNVYRLLNKMSATILRPRLLQLQTLQEWKRKAWYPTDVEWKHKGNDPEFPGMYMNNSTVRLLNTFKSLLHPKTDTVMQPIMDTRNDADTSLSYVFPNTRFITRSQVHADTLAHLGFMTYRRDPLRFKPKEEIDLLWLNANREVLLGYVRDGGYVIQSVGENFIRRHDYVLLGALTFSRNPGDIDEEYSGTPIFDTTNPRDYRTVVQTDNDFVVVSDIREQDLSRWDQEPHEEIDPQEGYTAFGCIMFDQAAAIVKDVTGHKIDIVANYNVILKRLQDEVASGDNTLRQIFERHSVRHTKLPYKRYGLGETYFVFQRKKDKPRKSKDLRDYTPGFYESLYGIDGIDG